MGNRPVSLSLAARTRRFYLRWQTLLVLLILFLSFRVLALLLLRPGGFITDSSDYDYYAYVIGRLSVKGYAPNVNLVTAYPPLFPPLADAVFWASSRLPPWIDPRLFFHTFLGLVLLVFETGNFLLIASIARRLAAGDDVQAAELPERDRGLPATPPGIRPELWPPLLYALLFAPLYTWLGWFESLPLFFLLLGLDLLLAAKERPLALAGSAAAAALGFLAKLTPIVLVPIAVRWLGTRLSWRAIRDEWFDPRSPGNLVRPIAYAVVFGLVTLGVGFALVRRNPSLAFATLQQLSRRQPWETVWALLVGYYGFGVLPGDERNPAAMLAESPTGRLPWTLIGLAFALVYLLLYVVPYDWRRRRTLVAFTAVTILWLFLYSRGWSPQFQIWVLALVVLLWPTMRGVLISVAFMFVNYAEAHVFFNMVPDQYWILQITVMLRTALLLALMAMALGDIWPPGAVAWWLRAGGRSLANAAVAVTLLSAVVTAPAVRQAYFADRFRQHPCHDVLAYLQEHAVRPPEALVTAQIEAWQQFYPWLGETYRIVVLDDYSPSGDPQARAEADLEEIARSQGGSFWWLEMDKAPMPNVADRYFARPGVSRGDPLAGGACRLFRVRQGSPAPAPGSASAHASRGMRQSSTYTVPVLVTT